jgi:uncharacterized protein (TIGR04551 family)
MAWSTSFGAALIAAFALAAPARAEDAKKDDAKKDDKAGGDDQKKIMDAVRAELEKAKEDMRDEVHAQLQGAQTAKEWGEVFEEEKPKLELLQLNGYLRVRGDLLDNLDLRRGPDSDGFYLYPRPIIDPNNRGTLGSANMRFRLEPTLNVSEEVKIKAQIDFLDNQVLGGTPEGAFQNLSDRYPLIAFSQSQVPPSDKVNAISDSVRLKRVWGEVKTPVGQLRFGRMGSDWGLGIMANGGNCLDCNYGDNVDRIMFATRVPTPVGQLTIVPLMDFISTGILSYDQQHSYGVGQPFDRDSADNVRQYGLVVARKDTDDELKRKLEQKQSSLNYGAYYIYRSQDWDFAGFKVQSSPPEAGQTQEGKNDPILAEHPIRRNAYAHILDLWGRWQTPTFRLEGELVGVYGEIGNASQTADQAEGPVLLRQFGGAVQSEWSFYDRKLKLGGEVGFASGDDNPGFGNNPGRGPANPGDIDGSQFRPGDAVMDIRNFRFNRDYRVDLILWREIIGGVTDAAYLKPTLRWEMLPGLVGTAAVIYSVAMYPESTPSSAGPGSGSRQLGIEGDLGINYLSDDGFFAGLQFGALQPLDGLSYANPAGRELTRAYAFRGSLGVKF